MWSEEGRMHVITAVGEVGGAIAGRVGSAAGRGRQPLAGEVPPSGRDQQTEADPRAESQANEQEASKKVCLAHTSLSLKRKRRWPIPPAASFTGT